MVRFGPLYTGMLIFLGAMILMFIGVLPQIIPLLLGVMYSFWWPQIWRNAIKGNRKSLSWRFVVGMSIARLAMPMCELSIRFQNTDIGGPRRA